jgi:hypothetical protein
MKPDQLPTSHPSFGVELGVIPFDRSYWVVPGRLLAGLYPSSENPDEASQKLQRLLDVGVSHLIDLTESGETNYNGVMLGNYTFELSYLAGVHNVPLTCNRHSIPDLGVPTVAMMKMILDEIDEAIKSGKTVYVHCWGGRGRTGTVVGCYLARHGMAVGDRALNMIRWLRRTDAKAHTEAPETPAQKAFVRSWSVGQ